MDISVLKAKIKANEIPDFLIFTGDEYYVQNLYINQIAKTTGKEVRRIEGFIDVYDFLQNKSFLRKEFIYILRDDADIVGNEKVQEQLNAGILGNNTLILLLTNVDKRTKFYKKFADRIVEFNALDENIIIKQIVRRIPISDDAASILCDVCENNLGKIMLEIDKMIAYKPDCDNYDEILYRLLDDGTIYTPPKDAVFDLVDAILRRDKRKSPALLDECKAINEANLVILTNLYNSTKQVLQVQACHSSDIAKTTGLTSWQIKNAKAKINYFSTEDLIYILRFLRNCEKGIKTGQIDDDILADYILVTVLR